MLGVKWAVNDVSEVKKRRFCHFPCLSLFPRSHPIPFFRYGKKTISAIDPDECQDLIQYYCDDPQVISASRKRQASFAGIALHHQLEPPKVLEHARYLKLRAPKSRHSWTEAELGLLDE